MTPNLRHEDMTLDDLEGDQHASGIGPAHGTEGSHDPPPQPISMPDTLSRNDRPLSREIFPSPLSRDLFKTTIVTHAHAYASAGGTSAQRSVQTGTASNTTECPAFRTVLQRSRTAIEEKAANIWATATPTRRNRDLQFNSQSPTGAIAERPCIGGRAWPAVIFPEKEHEYPFLLWRASTPGLLSHWRTENRSWSGRGTVTATGIPDIPTLEPRASTGHQLGAAETLFEDSSRDRFLAFDRIDEDPVRTEIDSFHVRD